MTNSNSNHPTFYLKPTPGEPQNLIGMKFDFVALSLADPKTEASSKPILFRDPNAFAFAGFGIKADINCEWRFRLLLTLSRSSWLRISQSNK